MGRMRARTTQATRGLAQRDRTQDDAPIPERLVTLPLDEVQPRSQGDVRSLNPGHVVSLAESIAALGLIEPIVVDRKGRMLAGGHRLAACRLLAAPAPRRASMLAAITAEAGKKLEPDVAKRLQQIETITEAHSPDHLPVRIIEFDSLEETERALTIEAAENTQRRDYTPREVLGLYRRLLDAGYTDRRGKPRRGERPAKPAISAIIGRSIRTVERMLNEALSTPTYEPALIRAMTQVVKAVGRLSTVTARETGALPAPAHALVEALTQPEILEILEDAGRFVRENRTS